MRKNDYNHIKPIFKNVNSASLQVVLELGLMDFETAGCAKMAKKITGTWESIVESWNASEKS